MKEHLSSRTETPAVFGSVLKVIADGALRYITIATFLFGVFSYLSNLDRTKSRDEFEKTEKFIDDYTAGRTAVNREVVENFWYGRIPPSMTTGANFSDRDAVRIFSVFVKPNEKYNEYAHAFNGVMFHLEQVRFCVEQQLCSAKLAKAFYCSEYRSLRPIVLVNLASDKERGMRMTSEVKEYLDVLCGQ